ncbi:MAG TPA: tetratricopeptide repeat protein [Chitinophagaceae bacterium]|nr:tetratricopeptide repeat protein [Chitinophagaceae bacterium]HPH32052.1 tetratricopeptide repeat protein [Chitinophagaceae bacterium]HPN58506.1 tetratricopeptide repeat protein [Chitinophagaceae bacterium]
MKKTTISILTLALLFTAGLSAQTLQDGKNHLFAERYNSAINSFNQLIASNPNNIEAIYWLGQSILQSEEIMSSRIAKTRQLYEKAMQTSNGAPLITVGLGHVDLLENKTNDARQKFETALTMTRTKKGENIDILNAVGLANADAKAGDYEYVIAKLKDAIDNKNAKNPETAVWLGNALRKARPGEGGGEAFRYYTKALEFNPNFPLANLRLAKLFESQKNWELVFQYLTAATKNDDKFTAAYYELFYYYFVRLDYTSAEAQLKKYIDSKMPEKDIQDEYLYAMLCWANKDYNCATSKGEVVVKSLGENTKPKVYRLLADAYFTKTEFSEAKKYSDAFFNKKNPDDLLLYDYQLRADILDKTGGTMDEVFNTYLQGALLDTTASLKVDFLKTGADKFKAKGDSASREREGDLRLQMIRIKGTPSQRDYFDAGFAYYQAKNYHRADSVFDVFVEKFPEETYGYMMEYNIHRAIDSTMERGDAVPWAEKYLQILEKDTVKNKNSILGVAGYLAQYHANIAKDKEKAIEYLQRMLNLDPTNEVIQKNIEILKKSLSPDTRPASNQPGKSTAPVAKTVKTPPGAKTAATPVVKK